jgi:hypothetical protein
MSAIVDGKRYSTDTSLLLAGGESTSGPEWIPKENIAFLFRARNGEYFAQFVIRPERGNLHMGRCWVQPMSEVEAIPLYWELPQKDVSFDEAFAPFKNA